MTHLEFSWQSSKGQSIYAQEWKPENARAVVALVHGLGEHSARYMHVAEALNAAGYGMIGFDLPGHGRSEGQRGFASYNDIYKEIDCLLAECAKRYPGLPRFLYGHSLGGALVLNYSLRCKPAIQGVVATSPGLRIGAPVPSSKLFLAKLMAKIMPSFSMDNGLDAKNLSHDAGLVQTYLSDPLVHKRISAQLGLDLILQGEWAIAHAAEFPLPLLLVQGSQDQIVSPAATAEFAKAAPEGKVTYKLWDGYYHETHNEPEKSQVIQYMIDWLNTKI